jgi:hypothetical protein
MLVAGCITVSCILTFVGIAAIGSFAASAAADKVASQTRLSSAATWSKPEDAVPSISLVAASPNRAGKSDALLLPARLASSAGVAGSQAPAFVLMQAGRPLALGPIIAARQASYLLIRGLPDEASLSSGQRKPSGAWLVRSDDLSALTLSFADDASGDYTADVYALGSAPAAQGRQRLVFRVEQGLGQVAATAPGRAAAMPDLTTPPPARAMPAPGSA